MDYQDKILAMARNAPLTPTMVAKAVGKDSLIASAMLSAMVEKGLLKISKVNVGSTPLYYDPNQAEQLQNYSSYLNEKDRKAYELLKEKKVLRENALDPLSRVCIKNIKDFSRPLEVSFGETKEIFWKWYLLPDSEAEPIIRAMLTGQAPAPESAPATPAPVPPEPVPQPPAPEPQSPEPEPEQEDKKVKSKPKKVKKKKVETQKRIVDKIKEMIVPAAMKGADAFLDNIKKYFADNDITVIQNLEQKRKSELEFIVEIGSSVGPLTYYCHAKDKKRVGEADLNNAFVQGQLIKLPVLFLTTGNLTKGAEKISKDFKGVAVKKI
ncbi:hypothetical protein KY310_01810 [Candidatus Woesearchaeota archaeon]|nr:hypothetical protein [Candidatus Woesearchaeota archaeon]